MTAKAKIGALATKALSQAGIQEQAPIDLTARLDTPLDDLVKLNKKKPKSLLEKVRAKGSAQAKPKTKAAGQPALASKVGKKVVAKDAKQAVRAILAAPQKSGKPKAPVGRPAPRLVPAGRQGQKPSAQQRSGSTFTVSLQNIRQNKLKKPAVQQRQQGQQGQQQRVSLKGANQASAGQRRSLVVNANNQQRKDQRQQVAQQRRIISGSVPAAGGKGLTLSERWSQNKSKQGGEGGNNGGARKVSMNHGKQGGRQQSSKQQGGKQQGGGTRFKVNF